MYQSSSIYGLQTDNKINIFQSAQLDLSGLPLNSAELSNSHVRDQLKESNS